MSAEALALPGVGDVVGEGRFELRSRLGEGGTGTVFLACDRLLDREVALKLLIPRYVGRPEREQRLVNEAEYLRRLRGHELVVQLIDTGRLRDRNGWPWMSTEIVRGQTLDSLIIRRTLGTAEKLAIARQIAAALVACQEAGVVHRDVNPNNVFVLDDGSVKLFDFSHAADLDGPKLGVGAPERLTRVFETPGTVGYIAPEQAANAAPDPSMDTFGFGVLLYELVSNSNPYSQYNNRDAFIMAQCEGTLETPRLQAWAYDAPEELAELVHECMQRDGARRPGMSEIVARLEAIAEALGHANATTPSLCAPAAVESTEIVEPPRAASADVTAAVDAPAVIATARRMAVAEAIGSWTRPDAPVVPLHRAGRLTPTGAAPQPEPEEQTGVLAFARPPQLREDASSTSGLMVERGPVFARSPELRPTDSGRSGGSDPEDSSAEDVDEVPPPLGPSRVKILTLVGGIGLLVTILSWFAYSKVVGDHEKKIDADRDRSSVSPQHPEATTESGNAADADTEAVAETSGMEVVPEIDPVETEPRPKNGKPKNGKPKNDPIEDPTKSPECAGVEDQARAAETKRDWNAVLELSKRSKCWSSTRERKRFEIRAYLNMGRWSDCIKAGEGSNDATVQRFVAECKDSL